MEFNIDLSSNIEITDSSSSFETNEIKIPLSKPTAIVKLSKSIFDDSSSQNSFVYSENSTESFELKNFIKPEGIEIPRCKNPTLSQTGSFITSEFDSSAQISISQTPNENYFTYKF